MQAIGVFGLIIALLILVLLVFKGYHVLPITLLASLIVFIMNGVDIWPSFMEGYMPALTGFVGNYLVMFLFGSLVGELLSKCGAATAIALKLAKVFGAKRALLIVILSSIILSYGGVAVFVIIFSIYPIALVLFQQADLPKRLIPGAIMLGAGSFTMTTLPGTPALTNIIPTKYLGTATTAAPTIGIICSIVMLITGYLILTAYGKKMVANGEHFVAGEKDKIKELSQEEICNLPGFVVSVIPIVVIIGIILGVRFAGIEIDSVYSVVLALAAGCLVTLVLFWNKIEGKKESLTISSQGSINAIMNTASVVGFGGAIKLAPAFQAFVNFATGLTFHPLISAALAVNIIAGITGSSSAGITIFMETMSQNFLQMGVNPDVLHRISSMAAGVLDSLPHAGPNVTFLMVTNLSYREGYPGIFISTCIVPFIGLCVALVLAFMGIV